MPAETPDVDLADIAPTDPSTPTYVAVRGDSAYEVAVENGFEGPVEQWLASLVGPQGNQGIQGIKGTTGATGPQGPQGIQGAPGSKVYPGPVGTGVGVDGDMSYNLTNGLLYWREGGSWVSKGTFLGPKGDQGDTGPQGIQGTKGDTGPAGAPGAVQSVNGISAAAVVLDAAAVNAVPDTAPGTAGGVAQLDETGKVPAAQLPPISGGGTVQSVAGQTPDANGNVALAPADVGAAPAMHTHTAAQVGALATTARAAANGVASLDAAARVPIAQIPAAAGRNEWTPQALGFAAWSCDPYTVANPVPKYLKPQRLFFVGFNITETTTVNRLVMVARGYGGVSTNRYRGAIYRENGTKVVESAGVALTMAGQEAGSMPAMQTNHIGAVPLTIASTSLTPGRYWVAWSL
ncbi:hypothetical protein J7E90_33025, partial [Streptomyces sp. ISL-111]|nr:hypothetical protein [Streptomyces sp. ISL-111]